MKASVIDLSGDRSPFETIVPDAAGLRLLTLVSIPRRTKVFHLDELTRRAVPDSQRRAADLSVFRFHGEEWARFSHDSNLITSLANRFENRPLAALLLDGRTPALFRLKPGRPPAPWINQQRELVAALRTADLASFTAVPGALLPKVPDFHYEGPNGDHYEEFLRVGIAFQGPDALDSFSFWMAEHMSYQDVVLFDSPTVTALGLAAQRYVSYLAEGSEVAIEFVRNYDEQAEVLAARLDQYVSERGGQEGPLKLLFVNSLCSSGRLSDRVTRATTTSAAHWQLSRMSLFCASDVPRGIAGDVLVALPNRFRRYPVRDCPLCKERSDIVRIEHRSYLLEISAASSFAQINKTDAARIRTFLDRYSGVGAISVHRDRHDAVRHHGIHVEVGRLLKLALFERRLTAVVERLRGSVDVVLAPDHKDAETLARMVADVLSVPVLVRNERALGDLSGDERAHLMNAAGILIVDDVVITGNRLRGFKNYLRDGGFVDEAKDIGALVAVARPAWTSALKGVQDYFHGALGLSCVEEILLPDLDERDCPWCWELEQWSSAEGSGAQNARRQSLSDLRGGLSDSLFLKWPAQSEPEMRLGPQSIFGTGLGQVEVFTAISSALQELRNSGKLSERPTTPIAKVLHPHLYIAGRYYDPVILSAILRAAQRHDVFATSSEKRLRRALESHFQQNTTESARAEVLLAMAQRKLPTVERAVSSLRELGTEDDTSRLLAGLIGKE